MDFTAIDTTIFNLNRADVNNKEKNYKTSVEAWTFSEFCNSQSSHYSLLINLATFQFSHSALTLPKKSKFKHK